MSFGAEAITWACWCKGWWTNNVLDAAGVQTGRAGPFAFQVPLAHPAHR
jgi:hypothetical protein